MKKLYLVTKKKEDGELGYRVFYKKLFTCEIAAKKEKEKFHLGLSFLEEIEVVG